MIKLCGVAKDYIDKKTHVTTHALNDINLEFNDCGMCFILGKSGSGKSTLLNIIGLLDKPTNGSIYFNENNVSLLKKCEEDKYRNENISYVFQSLNLFEENSVRENISLACELQRSKITDSEIESILEKVDLKGFINRKVDTLSGGQKQRVAIARALAKESKVILADEPTGALDESTGDEIFTLLKQISKKMLVIVVSHNSDAARKFGDRIIEISDGKVLKDSSIAHFESPIQEVKKEPRGKISPLGFLTKKSLSYIWKRKARLIATSVVSIFSFGIMGLSYSIGNYDKKETISSYLSENKSDIHLIKKACVDSEATSKDNLNIDYSYISEPEFLNIKKGHDIEMFPKPLGFKFESPIKSEMKYSSIKDYYLYATMNEFSNSNIIALTSNSSILKKYNYYGNIPFSENEIMISDVHLEAFKTYNFNDYKTGDFYLGSTITKENIIGKSIAVDINNEKLIFNISGVFNTGIDFDKYDIGDCNTKLNRTEEKLFGEVGNYKNKELFNTLFLSETFFQKYIDRKYGFYDVEGIKAEINNTESSILNICQDLDKENTLLFKNTLQDNDVLLDCRTSFALIKDRLSENGISTVNSNHTLQRLIKDKEIVENSLISDEFSFGDSLEFNLTLLPDMKQIDSLCMPRIYEFAYNNLDELLNKYKDEIIKYSFFLIGENNISVLLNNYETSSDIDKETAKQQVSLGVTYLMMDALEGSADVSGIIAFPYYYGETFNILKQARSEYSLKINEIINEYVQNMNSLLNLENIDIKVNNDSVEKAYKFGGIDLRFKYNTITMKNCGDLINERKFKSIVISDVKTKKDADYLAKMHCGLNLEPSIDDPTIQGEYFVFRDNRLVAFDEIDHAMNYIKNISFITSIAFALVSTILLGQFIICSVNDRKKEIGILRSLGAKKFQILYLYYFEAFVLTMIISLISCVFSGLLCYLFSNILKDYFVFDAIICSLSIKTVIMLIFGGLIVSVLSFVVAISTIIKCNPIDIMKHTD